jgi:hypothetical protein
VIPAILAAPVVEGILGQVIGMLSPQSSSSSAPTPSFTPALNKAATVGTPVVTPSPIASASGTMTSSNWSQMSATDLQSWMKSLAGSHVHATDISGRTISGIVEASQQTGGTPSLNVGGHLVSLSQLNQITWSPAVR